MFYIDNDSGVTVMPPVSAQRSAIVRWFSEGDGNNVITWPGMDWFNIVQAELLNTLEEAGIQPDKTKLNQLALSIKAIMSDNALLKENNLSEIKTAGASAQRTARENLDICDASLNKKGLVQLTSDTDNDSETLAATAKAVKIAMDNASARLAKDRNGADIPNKPLFIQNLGLQETVNLASGALQKDQNGADIQNPDTFVKNTGAARAFSGSVSIGGDNGNWTTAQFIDWLESQGAFNHPYWMCKGSWSYASNKIITDTGCGNIQLAGAVVEVMGVKGAMTIRVTTPTTVTNGSASAQFTYINHGNDYSPGWRRDYNTKNQQPAFALGQTGSTVGNDKAVAWNSISGVYNATISGASTLILHFYMGAGSCPAVQFRVNYKNGGIYYRSARDGYGFESDWSEFYTTTRKPSAGDVGAYSKTESDSRYALKTAAVTSIRLGTYTTQTMQKGVMFEKAGYVITGLGIIGEVDEDDPARLRPLQYCINGSWYTAATI